MLSTACPVGSGPWGVFALFVLITPDDAFVPSVVVLGLIPTGIFYFATMLVFNRAVLDAEPEAAHADS